MRLALAAREHLFSIAEREGIDFDLERRGILHIYKHRKDYDAAAKVNELLREGGLDRHAVGASEIGRIEPALQGDFHGGFFTPSDSTGDIHKFTRGLARPARDTASSSAMTRRSLRSGKARMRASPSARRPAIRIAPMYSSASSYARA